MSLNYIFGISLFLISLVMLNVYFFYTLNDVDRKLAHSSSVNVQEEPLQGIFKEINDHLNYLPHKYKSRNRKFTPIQRNLINSFNLSTSSVTNVWENSNNWFSEDSLFPYRDGASAQIIQAMQKASIALVDNAPKGTQLKLMFLLQDKKILYFKPKRYDLEEIIHGSIYSGFDRHNSEVLGYYLAIALNYTWVAPATIRRIHIERDLMPVATEGLKKTMLKSGNGSLCIYGKCFYCKANATVCADSKGELEGAVVLYLDKKFKIFKYPWRRSYSKRKMEWENNHDFCNKVIMTISTKRLLNLIDIAIFDFLLQNGDRHGYEVYKDKVILLDNGKGLGNPAVDELDILAPLYQCCMVSMSTWQHLELISGGSLTDVLKLTTSFQGEILATGEHFKAIERRLLKIYATIQYCIGKHGSARVFRLGF